MAMHLIILNAACVSLFMLAFIAFINPLKVNVIANKWFGVFLFSAGSAVLDVLINQTGHSDNYRQLIIFNELSRYAIAPALYLSVLHYTAVSKQVRPREYLHFIPVLIFAVFTGLLVFAPGMPNLGNSAFASGLKIVLPILVKLSIPIQLVVYWLLSYRMLRRHLSNVNQIVSDNTPVSLQWLRQLLWGILFMIVLSVTNNIPSEVLRNFIPLGYLAGTVFITYYLLVQKEVYPYEEVQLQSLELILNPVEEKPKARLSAELMDELKARLISLMETERMFLNSELNLPELSEKMGVSPHDVSYVLNEGMHSNFYQFINAYRVAEAKQLMQSGKYSHLNILGIAYNAGFNSKTTFNTAFKRETGLSPSQFMKQTADSQQTVIA
ncbi:helix-turn-helix domain-containing protein [Mucilaginibacter auburnensis]|uniref:AraC-like DNA-binding protein n=1 Tax=Mucilaginibacter auburnensis TaxID=1457233 RepID=A0A2H9VPV2_9SPHI|nr:AraC family transcriptional regulator [Mucilaginibacter auburnensis]PJJ80367.1 AraC-like DNA-binding protein [Mucilaginibacter auburnensis]